MGVTWPPIIKPMGWMKAMSSIAMGDAVMVPGPLPWQADDPRPFAASALLSQPVAVIVAQAARPLPLGRWPGWTELGRAGLAWLASGVETAPHPAIRAAVSSAEAGQTALNMVLHAATSLPSDPYLLVSI